MSDSKNITLWGVDASFTITLQNELPTEGFVGFWAWKGSPPSQTTGWSSPDELKDLGMTPNMPDPWPSSGTLSDCNKLKFDLNIARGETIFYRLVVRVGNQTYHDDPKIYNDPNPPPPRSN